MNKHSVETSISKMFTKEENSRLIVMAGGSLVLHGVIDETNDIDCYFQTEEEVEAFAVKHALTLVKNQMHDGKAFIHTLNFEISSVPSIWVDIQKSLSADNRLNYINEITCWSINACKIFYKQMGREKDIEKLRKIEEFRRYVVE